jgi:hypothetical protein
VIERFKAATSTLSAMIKAMPKLGMMGGNDGDTQTM